MESNSLDFKIDIRPKPITEHIEPDVDLSVDKYDAVYANQQEEEIEAPSKDLLIQEYDITQANNPLFCFAAVAVTAIPGILFIVLSSLIYAYPLVFVLELIQFLLMKNLIGQKLVGLRWWIEIKNSEQKWGFQTSSDQTSNKVDKYFFWACLVYGTLFWALMCFGDFFGLHFLVVQTQQYQLPLPIFSFLLSALNLHGFYKCRGEHKKKLDSLKKEMAKTGMNIVGMIMK